MMNVNSGQNTASKAVEHETDFATLAGIELWLCTMALFMYCYARHSAESSAVIVSFSLQDPGQWTLSPFCR